MATALPNQRRLKRMAAFSFWGFSTISLVEAIVELFSDKGLMDKELNPYNKEKDTFFIGTEFVRIMNCVVQIAYTI